MGADAKMGSTEPEADQHFSLREAARILEVPEARLRALARAGLLTSQHGPIGPLSFAFHDLLLLRTTKGLLESGVPMRQIRRIWVSLREQLSAELPLTSISIHTDGEQVVASDGRVRWRPESGQMLLDFEAREIVERAGEAVDAGSPRVLALLDAEPAPGVASPDGRGTGPASGEFVPQRAPAAGAGEAPPSAEDWYQTGCELEASGLERAREAYQRALELDPGLPDAHVNVGRLLHLGGEPGRAEFHYREAVRLAPDDPTPHFNLGVLLEEVGRRDEAVHAYRQAVLRDPDFADAHCNLALLLESLGRRQEAVRHLMAARQLSGAPE